MAEVLAPEPTDYFTHSPLPRSPPSSTFLVGSPASFASELQQKFSASQHAESVSTSCSSAPPSLHSSHIDLPSASIISTPATSYSFENSDAESEEISFPSYDEDSSSDEDDEEELSISPKTVPTFRSRGAEKPSTESSPRSNSTPHNTPDSHFVSEDDTSVRHQPTQQVDYLSYDWKEEDIWASWRHIVSQRKVYGKLSRLENASWRTWTKQKYKLRTVAPETLNWLKDCDVTWLYGPLQTAKHKSEPPSNLSKSNSFLCKKPILKKRSVSEIMLQKSLSTSSLIQQATASIKAQENMNGGKRVSRPSLGCRAHSEMSSRTSSADGSNEVSVLSTSGARTPADGERRHIRFDEKVEQCIAVDAKDDDEESVDHFSAITDEDDDESDDGVVMMKSDRRRPMSRSNSRTSFSGSESKTIAKLPATTLKNRTDSPDIPEHPSHSLSAGFWRPPKLSPSPSQETLRPSNPSTNFLLHDDDDDEDEDEDEDISWEPSGAFSKRVDSLEQLDRQYAKAERETSPSGLRRTESGMFMPAEGDADDMMNQGLLGRVVDTYNTARDIAHVIWNVGWRNS